jgi:hypothetical protein
MYNFVPSDALVMFVSCLCRVVNLKEVKITTSPKKQWFVGRSFSCIPIRCVLLGTTGVGFLAPQVCF